MTNIDGRPSPPPKLIQRLIDARTGAPGAQAMLDAHLASHPDHRDMATELGDLWDEIGRLEPPPLRQAAPESRTRLRANARWLVPTALAAAIAGVVLIPVLSRTPPSAAVEHFTAGASTRRLAFSDGSIVTLAARSVLDVQMSPVRRSFDLRRGEAYFAVAHDKARPFVVSAQYGETIAVGTAFDVRLEGAEAVVTVTEGTVKIASPQFGPAQFVTKGEQLRYRGDTRQGRAAIGSAIAVDSATAIEWTSGFLRFDEVPLAVVIKRVNEHAPRKLVLEDAKLARMPITAILKVGEVDGLMAIVAAQAQLRPEVLRRSLRVDDLG